MPSKSPAQKKLMQAAANNPAFAKVVGIPQSVAREFGEDEPSKLAMDYTQIIAPMVKAIQELNAKVEALKNA
jgi:hypothetical protein